MNEEEKENKEVTPNDIDRIKILTGEINTNLLGTKVNVNPAAESTLLGVLSEPVSKSEEKKEPQIEDESSINWKKLTGEINLNPFVESQKADNTKNIQITEDLLKEQITKLKEEIEKLKTVMNTKSSIGDIEGIYSNLKSIYDAQTDVSLNESIVMKTDQQFLFDIRLTQASESPAWV